MGSVSEWVVTDKCSELGPQPELHTQGVMLSCSAASGQHSGMGKEACSHLHLLAQGNNNGAMEKRCQPSANDPGARAGRCALSSGCYLRLYPQLPIYILFFSCLNQTARERGRVQNKTKQRLEIYPSINYLHPSRAAYEYGATLDKTFMQLFRPSEI